MNISFKFAVKIFILATIVLNVVFTIPVMAQTKAPSVRDELKEHVREINQSVKTQIKTENENIKTKRTELNTQLKEAQEAAKKHIEAAREETKKVVETRRAELKDKISKLRDEKKKQIAARLDEQLSRLNVQWTDHFSNVLSRLSEILGKIELRADKAESNDGDVSAARTAIQNAKTAIESARTAVEVQAKKTYIAAFTSENELGAAFKTVKEQLRTDLAGLRDGLIKDARKAVQDVFQLLLQIPGVDKESTTTSASAETNE